jgi:DNA-binding winged helix-turn-helix (wHTH) protein
LQSSQYSAFGVRKYFCASLTFPHFAQRFAEGVSVGRRGMGERRATTNKDAKPFFYGELRGRVRALLRRSERRRRAGRLRVGTLELDPSSRSVRVGGRPVALTQTEFALLLVLAAAPTTVHSKAELLRTVWGFHAASSTRTLDSHACRLRGKLAVAGGRFVLNVWGVGYRLVDDPGLDLDGRDLGRLAA